MSGISITFTDLKHWEVELLNAFHHILNDKRGEYWGLEEFEQEQFEASLMQMKKELEITVQQTFTALGGGNGPPV